MDLTKILKFKSDYETADFLGITPVMVGKYKKGVVPRHRTIEKFQEKTKGKINFYTFYGKNSLKTNK